MDDKRSTSGSCIFLWAKLGGIKFQEEVPHLQITNVGYCWLAHSTLEILWIESLLTELHIPFLPPTLLCDNQSVVHLTHNPIMHARTKHMEFDIHFMRERVATKKFTIQHVLAAFQLADIFTKPFGSATFCDLRG